MATLVVSSTFNYSSSALANITHLTFTNVLSNAVATFAATQFGPQISNSLVVTGSPAGDCGIIVNGNVIDASGWTFSNWSTNDHITLFGTAGDDTLTGSLQRDLIDGGSGADLIRGGLGIDTLRGFTGDDTFFFSAAETAASDSIDGGADFDTMQVIGSGTFNFEGFIINNVERLLFDTSGTSTVLLDASRIGGAGDILTVTGGSAADRLTVVGSGINLTAVTFVNWTAGVDSVVIEASSGTATGSSQNDEFRDSGQGAIAMNGGDGDDLFHYLGSGGSAAGDAINGGLGGNDTILLGTTGAAASINLTGLVSLTGVERIAFADSTAVSATISEALIATGVATIAGGAASDQLTVQITALNGGFDATDLTFLDWTDGQDRLTILGNAGNNVLTGTLAADSIVGAGGNDRIHGGAGGDTLDGGTGDRDTLDYSGSTAVIVVLAANAASGGDAQGDVISNFENVTGGDGGDILVGNDLANRIRGGGGADTLQGGAGPDRLDGGAGRDHITGGTGKDVMTGGGQADIFIFTAVADSPSVGPRDLIADFEQGSDRIDLSGIDAVAGGLDDAFVFRGSGGFGPSAGLKFIHTATQTIVRGDVNGDQKADFAIALDGLFTLVAADFAL